MEQSLTENPMLKLIERPAFCVQNGIIIQANEAAVQKQIQIGLQIDSLLQTDLQVYKEYSGKPLQLSIFIAGKTYQASVERINDVDIFLMETEKYGAELQLLALTAMHFRTPLSGVMPLVELLLTNKDICNNPEILSVLSQVNRGLYQIQRLVCDMSDAGSDRKSVV